MQLIWNGPNTTRYLESIYQTPAIGLPPFFLRLLWGRSRETSFSTSRTVSHTTELWNQNSPTSPIPRRVSTRASWPLGHRVPSSPAIFWGHRQTSRLHQVTFAFPGSISSPTLWSITSNHSLATIFFFLTPLLALLLRALIPNTAGEPQFPALLPQTFLGPPQHPWPPIPRGGAAILAQGPPCSPPSSNPSPALSPAPFRRTRCAPFCRADCVPGTVRGFDSRLWPPHFAAEAPPPKPEAERGWLIAPGAGWGAAAQTPDLTFKASDNKLSKFLPL